MYSAAMVDESTLITTWLQLVARRQLKGVRASRKAASGTTSLGGPDELKSGMVYALQSHPYEPLVMVMALIQSTAKDVLEPANLPPPLKEIWQVPQVAPPVVILYSPFRANARPRGADDEQDNTQRREASEELMLAVRSGHHTPHHALCLPVPPCLCPPQPCHGPCSCLRSSSTGHRFLAHRRRPPTRSSARRRC